MPILTDSRAFDKGLTLPPSATVIPAILKAILLPFMSQKYNNEIFAVFRTFLNTFSRAQTVPYAFRSIKTPQISSEVSFGYRLVSKKVFVQ